MPVRTMCNGRASGWFARVSIRHALAPFLAAGLLLPRTVHAQTENCAPCVRLVPVAELSTAVAPIVPSQRQSVLRTADGRFLVSHRLIDDPQIVVYDSAGRFIRLYDAVGGGPGELRGPPVLFPGPGGGIWAVDQNRLLRFDARLRHVETSDLRSQFGVSRLFPLTDDTFLLAGLSSLRDTFTVGIVDVAGAWDDRRIVVRALDPYGAPIAAPAVAGGFWSMEANQLKLRRYSEDGAVRDSIELAIPYFEPWSGPLEGEGYEGWNLPPRPRQSGVFDAGADRIVVLTRLTEDDWKPTPRDQMINFSERDENVLHDTAVALVDASTGRMIASLRSEEDLHHVNGTAGYVYSTHANADGHVITKIYRIVVR
jgi:hypothetical protein